MKIGFAILSGNRLLGKGHSGKGLRATHPERPALSLPGADLVENGVEVTWRASAASSKYGSSRGSRPRHLGTGISRSPGSARL